MYILTTTENHYFVEYLLEYLVVSDSISEAMVFEENELITAKRFQQMLLEHCNIFFSINTFIN